MGLFDTIKCELPLDGDPGDLDWQTKSFPDPAMDKYTIRSDGTLWLHPIRFERPAAPPHEETKAEFLERFQKRTRIELAPEQIDDLHGDICFYSTDKKDEWWSYTARFTEGKLVRIFRN